MEFLRFFTVSVLGLIIDLGLAWVLAAIVGVPLVIASLTGFLCAAGVNYALHEMWTFRYGTRQLSAARSARFGVVLLLTLAARLGIVVLAAAVLPGSGMLLPLLIGASGSFCLTYGLSRVMVFRPTGRGESR